jgi:hypothetical protein
VGILLCFLSARLSHLDAHGDTMLQHVVDVVVDFAESNLYRGKQDWD